MALSDSGRQAVICNKLVFPGKEYRKIGYACQKNNEHQIAKNNNNYKFGSLIALDKGKRQIYLAIGTILLY